MSAGEASDDRVDPLAPIRARLAVVTEAWASGEMTLAEIRASFDAFLKEMGPRGAEMASASRRDVRRRDLPAAWVGEGPRRLLYCHGGGYQIGSIDGHAGLACRIAEAAQAAALLFDYRLAPEHRFPAAADDAVLAYEMMVAEGGAPAAVVGDSAGGALALIAAIHARDAGLPTPKAIVLLSPWLDLTMQGESYVRLAERDSFSTPAQLQAMARSYLGREGDGRSPQASPLFGDLQRLPPILVHAGSDDITLDDSRLLDQRVQAAGGRITLRIFRGMCHHFQIFEALPEVARSIADIGAFIRETSPGV